MEINDFLREEVERVSDDDATNAAYLVRQAVVEFNSAMAAAKKAGLNVMFTQGQSDPYSVAIQKIERTITY